MKKDYYVVGAVIVKGNKILCAQRGSTRNLAFKWEFPGGKIEKGESPHEALKREIMEEMNCKIDVLEKIDQTKYEYDFGIIHLTTFYCKIITGNPVLTVHEQIKWLSPDELTSLDWAPADIPTVLKLK